LKEIMNQLVINSHEAKLKFFGRLALNIGLIAYFSFMIVILFQPLSINFSEITSLNSGKIIYYLLILLVIYFIFLCLKNIYNQLIGRQIIISNQELIYKNRFSEIQKVNLLSIKEIISERRKSYGKSPSYIQIVFYDIGHRPVFTCSNMEYFSKKQLGQILFYLQKYISVTNIKLIDNLDLIKENQYPSPSFFRYSIALIILLPFSYFSYIILSGGIDFFSLFLAGFIVLISFFLATYYVEDLV